MKNIECLKASKLFLKMAECDLAVIKVVKLVKLILTAALIVNSAAFAVSFCCGMKNKKCKS